MTIALIGYRGAGKSAVGHTLARLLQWPCIDSDEEIEKRAGCSIQEIFLRHGEAVFRQWESQVLRELVTKRHTVLALGGGVVLLPENRRLLAPLATVWLTAPASVLYERLAADPKSAVRRPALTHLGDREEIERLLEQRRPLYEECARLRVDTSGLSVEEVARQIARWWQLGAPPMPVASEHESG